MHISFNPQRVLLLSIFTVGILSVNAQDRWSRYEALVGINGESSCDLHMRLINCPKDSQTKNDAERSAPPILTGPNPPVPPTIALVAPAVERLGRRDDPNNPLIGTMNMCTCNSIGFNIWSACRYSMGFAEQPALNEWMSACKDASVDLPGALALSSEPEGLGFRAPAWALVPVPGGRYFDMQSATKIALTGTLKAGWTPIQIILPILTAALSAFFVIILGMQMKAKQYVESQRVLRDDTESARCASPDSDTFSITTKSSSPWEPMDRDLQPESPTENLKRISMHSTSSSASSTFTICGEHMYDVKLSDDPVPDEAKTDSS